MSSRDLQKYLGDFLRHNNFTSKMLNFTLLSFNSVLMIDNKSLDFIFMYFNCILNDRMKTVKDTVCEFTKVLRANL